MESNGIEWRTRMKEGKRKRRKKINMERRWEERADGGAESPPLVRDGRAEGGRGEERGRKGRGEREEAGYFPYRRRKCSVWGTAQTC